VELLSRTLAGLKRAFGDLLGPAFFVVLGCLICQLGLGYGYAVKPLAGKIMQEFSWTQPQYFWTQSPISVTYALASLVVGTLVIRFGARRILIASVLLLALVFALYSRMQSLHHMFGLVILMGVAIAGLGDITVGQLVSQWVKRGRGLALGIVYTGSNLGGYLFIPMAVGIAEESSWRDAFLSLSGIALMVLLPAALFLVREQPGIQATSKEDIEADASQVENDLNLAQAIRTRTFWVLALSLFCFFFYFMALLDHLVLFLTGEGLELREASVYLRRALGLGIVSKIALGIVADRISHRLSVLGVFLGLAVSAVVLLVLPGGALLMWVFVVGFGASAAARDVVYPLIVSECFGLRYMAQIYGALMLAFLPGATLGPIFAAEVHARLGSYRAAFVTFAVLNLLTVAALLVVRDERRPGEGGADG
jgi:MFS family permease